MVDRWPWGEGIGVDFRVAGADTGGLLSIVENPLWPRRSHRHRSGSQCPLVRASVRHRLPDEHPTLQRRRQDPSSSTAHRWSRRSRLPTSSGMWTCGRFTPINAGRRASHLL